jgi:ABC-2 type transport system ATP-binding protein
VIVEVEDLAKEYGETQALRRITFRIETGGAIGLLGPNGAGKTTLVEILEGLRTPSSGRVLVLGMDPLRQAPALRERLGVQLQSTALPRELTPLETLRLFGALFRKALPPMRVLERVGLADQAHHRNYTLSSGQQRRLAIAMALISDPELVILDEPTSGLDPAARRDLHHQIGELRTAGRTVLLTTHSIAEAETLCDRVIILRSGEIVADGKPFELVARASGSSTLWIRVDRELDPTPLLRAGMVDEGREGEYYRFATDDPAAAVAVLGKLLQDQGATLLDLRMRRPNLEDVYLQLMGGEAPPLEDDEPA